MNTTVTPSGNNGQVAQLAFSECFCKAQECGQELLGQADQPASGLGRPACACRGCTDWPSSPSPLQSVVRGQAPKHTRGRAALQWCHSRPCFPASPLPGHQPGGLFVLSPGLVLLSCRKGSWALLEPDLRVLVIGGGGDGSHVPTCVLPHPHGQTPPGRLFMSSPELRGWPWLSDAWSPCRKACPHGVPGVIHPQE